MKLVAAVRSALFYLLFIGQTAIIAIIIGTIALIVRGRTALTWALTKYWGRSNLFLLHSIAGISTDVTGAENIPEGGCIIASKHQSDWDVFAILPYTGRPAYIVKKELMRIPFFGWAARSLDCIEVDRSRGPQAFTHMMDQARAALGRGCRIVIFPEGTRKAPLSEPHYKTGLSRMYADLNVPVVPVALNSGLFWGRNSLILWPGKARARFLPPIMPGLTPAAFQERLVANIEAASNQLMLEAYEEGLSRPLGAEEKGKFSRLKSKVENVSTTS